MCYYTVILGFPLFSGPRGACIWYIFVCSCFPVVQMCCPWQFVLATSTRDCYKLQNAVASSLSKVSGYRLQQLLLRNKFLRSGCGFIKFATTQNISFSVFYLLNKETNQKWTHINCKNPNKIYMKLLLLQLNLSSPYKLSS